MVPTSTRLTQLRNSIGYISGQSARWSRGRASSLALMLGALAAVALCASVGERLAVAQDKKTVAVLEIQGAPPKLQASIEKTLKSKYNVLPAAKWNAAAKKLNVTGQGTDEVALVAGELKVDAVITGKIKADKDAGTYKLNIAARHGATGKPLGKLTYELKSAKVDPGTIAAVEQDIAKAVDEAIAGPPPEAPPVVAAAPEPVSPSLAGKEENPLEKMKKMEEDQKKAANAVRPTWYPYIDAGAAFILNGRSFNYSEEAGNSPVKCYDFDHRSLDMNIPQNTSVYVYKYTPALKSCPRYAPSISTGVRADVTGYPLAGVGVNAVRGLGIGITFDYMFWPASMTSGAMPRSLDTREFRLEVGLRYHYNVLGKRSSPSILANVQYGIHSFAVAKEMKTYMYPNDSGLNVPAMGIDDHGLPDILYQYLTIGVGARVPYYTTEKMFFGLLVNFNFHIMLNYGEIGSSFADISTTDAFYGSGGYGPASGYGFRVGFTPLEMVPWKGLTIRVNGFYEMFATSFSLGSASNMGVSLPPVDRTIDNAARHIAQGATDQYFGGVLQVGYQY